MNGKTSLMICLNFVLLLFGLAGTGSAYNLSDSDVDTAYYGVKEQKVGQKIMKKRYVSASSIQQSIDKDEDFQLALAQYPKMRVVATGYYAGIESTGKTPSHPSYGITYSGVKVRRSMYSTIAADLRVFPLGSILYIPGYGYGVVADIGGAIRGKKIDLYFNSKQDVFNLWGKKTLDIYLIQKGQGVVTEKMMQALHEKGIAAMVEFSTK